MTSVPGTLGNNPIVFTVPSSAANNLARIFADGVLGKVGSLLSDGGTSASIYNIVDNVTTVSSVSLTGGEYTFAEPGESATTIAGSSGGYDSVLGSNITYDATGNFNVVAMIDGDNTYSGGASSFDTIAGGGNDSIDSVSTDFINAGTGGGNVVFDGGGKESIVLQDAASYGDIAYLQQGSDIVFADGLLDTVVSAVSGAQITGGTSVSDSDLFVFESNSVSGSSGTADTVATGAGTTTVFDGVGGNVISGSATSGALTFIAGGAISDTIVGGAGGTSMFGASGSSFTFSDSVSSGTGDIFVAGAGNETLLGANTASFIYYGSSDSTSADSVTASFTGSTTFVTGLGSETLVGGSDSSSSLFYVTGGGSSIAIENWNANDSIAANLTNDTVSSATDGSTVITLADNTQIELIGFSGPLTNLYNTGG